MRNKPTICLIGIILFITLVGQQLKADSRKSESNIIRRFCLLSVNQEMKSKEKVFPEGFASYTCDCFLSKVKTGKTIKSAQLICKEEVSKKYNF